MTAFLDSISELSEKYDGFFIDLWGVMHDGVRPFAKAVAVLDRLRNKRVLLLSNAPRRSSSAQRMLRKIGIEDALYTHILTSGEATWLALRERSEPWFAKLGHCVYHLGPARDRNLLENLGLDIVAGPETAHFIVNTGPDDERETAELSSFADELERCRLRNLPMVCANPDLIVKRAKSTILCAGALAEEYARLGGDIRLIGKPDPSFYQLALQNIDLPASAVLAIGDSLRTDITGAAASSIDAVWILDGIHGHETADQATATQLLKTFSRRPVAAMRQLAW